MYCRGEGRRRDEQAGGARHGCRQQVHPLPAEAPLAQGDDVTPYYQDSAVTIYCGDARDLLRGLPDASAHCCVTSPPYWGLRDYGVPGQLGLEATPEAYVAALVEVFREVRRVLRDDGTCWLNLGDSYAGSWGNYGGQNRGNGTQREIVTGSQAHQNAYDGLEGWRPPTADAPGLKPKDLVGIPWRVAFALQADGWYLRQDIIWSKPNPMPESVTDRCTKAHEYIFLLSKSAKYYYDADAVREENSETSHTGGTYRNEWKYAPLKSGTGKSGMAIGVPIPRNGRNRRSVWTVATQPYAGAHFATFPPALIEPCILAGVPRGGTVLDPFGGSGTTASVALKLARQAVLIELNPEYMDLACRRLGSDEQQPDMFREPAPVQASLPA